jgi:hypothetical protein
VAIREAVDIRRRLATADPARFEPDLAQSLQALSTRLSDTGDRAESLMAIRETVDVYRRLATADPGRFEPDLAQSLVITRNSKHALNNRASNRSDLPVQKLHPFRADHA